MNKKVIALIFMLLSSCTTMNKNNIVIEDILDKDSNKTTTMLDETLNYENNNPIPHVGIIDEFKTISTIDSYDRIIIETKYSGSKSLSHGEKVALNVEATSNNAIIHVAGLFDPKNDNSELMNVKTKELIDNHKVKIVNYSIGVETLYEDNDYYTNEIKNKIEDSIEIAKLNSEKLLSGLDNKDVVLVFAAGNTISSKNNLSLQKYTKAVENPTTFLTARYPIYEPKYRKNILNVIAVTPDKQYYYKNGDILKTNQDIVSDLKFLDTNFGEKGNYHLSRYNNRNFAKAGQSKYWSVASDSLGIFNIDNKREAIGIGSSFSAPKVTGLLSRIQYKYPFLTANQLKQVVLTTADRTGYKGLSDYIGWGIVDYDKAIKGPSNFIKYLVLDDNINNTENGKYFVANIPENQTYSFDNDISGGFLAKELEIDDPIELSKDSGLKKTGKGKLILNGVQKYNEEIFVEDGTLEINNDVTGDVKVNTNLIVNNTLKSNVVFNKNLIVENGELTTYPNLIVKGETRLGNSKININSKDNYIFTNKLSLKDLSNIFINDIVTEKRNLIYTKDGITAENMSSFTTNYLNYYIDNNNIVVSNISDKPMSNLLEEASNKELNIYEKAQLLEIQNATNILSEKEASNDIYIATNLTNFNLLNIVNSKLNSRHYTYLNKDSFYLNGILNFNKYEESDKILVDSFLSGFNVGYEYKYNNRYMIGAAINYSKNLTKYDGLKGSVDSDAIILSNYHHIKDDLFYYMLNFNIGYVNEKSLRKDNIKATTHNLVGSIDTKVAVKMPIINPYIGLQYDYIVKGNLEEEGNGLLLYRDPVFYGKTKMYMGGIARVNLGSFFLTLVGEVGYNVMNASGDFNTHYKGFDTVLETKGLKPHKIEALIEADMKFKLNQNFTLSIDASQRTNKNRTFKLGLEYMR